jgi:large subunit ribosomal protein L13
MQKTYSAKPGELVRKWYVVDLKDQILGRAATQIANVLRGKNKPTFTPHVDTGDFVIVVNANQISLSGSKWAKKTYYRHTQFIGHLKQWSAEQLQAEKPEALVLAAVQGMLPKGSLGRELVRKLKIYPGPEHPHQAQQPVPLPLDAAKKKE